MAQWLIYVFVVCIWLKRILLWRGAYDGLSSQKRNFSPCVYIYKFDKTNKIVCASSEDSDHRPVWSESLLSTWRNFGTLPTHWMHSELWSDWADAQADPSLRWAHRSFCQFCQALALIIIEPWPCGLYHIVDQAKSCNPQYELMHENRCNYARSRHYCNMTLVMRKPVSGICDQDSHKPACPAIEARQPGRGLKFQI